MKYDKDLKSAFPSTVQYFPDDTSYDEQLGMTLRDYFAAKALPVLPVMSSYNMLPKETLEHFQARKAYSLADAMMEARK